jgi:hypothetical protein
MKEPMTVYDPTDVQLNHLRDRMTEKLSATDLARPEIVQLINEQQEALLIELKITKAELMELRSENRKLTETRENLRVQIAKIEQHQTILWLEIPLSVIGAFSVNMLTNDLKDMMGWFLLLISLMMLLFLRLGKVETISGRGQKDAEEKN